MVSFQCESCGDILTKKKLDAHLNRCWNTSFTCLDCHTQFWNRDYKTHTSCISEAEKYQGVLYKERAPKTMMQQQSQATPAPPRTPYQAYVKDAEDESSPLRNSFMEIKVPQPIPTPPSIQNGIVEAPPVNVFDFLVDGDRSASPSASSSASSVHSDGADSDISMSPEIGRSPASSGPDSPRSVSPPNGVHINPALYSYGNGPIDISDRRFDSEYDFNMQLQRVNVPPAAPTPPTATAQAPALPPPSNDTPSERKNDPRSSDKKRKRPPMEDLDTAKASESRSFHTGLTGGLTRLLSGSKGHQNDASPLSPKKRSKRANNNEATGASKSHDDEESRRRKERRENRRSQAEKRERRSKRREQKLLEGPKDLKAIEFNPTPKSQLPEQCNSEFFLSLIDKDHRSLKGQSIWGVLKMFHEGRAAAGSMETDENEAKRDEEKKLFKGLRVKISKTGEVILFSRAAAELEG